MKKFLYVLMGMVFILQPVHAVESITSKLSPQLLELLRAEMREISMGVQEIAPAVATADFAHHDGRANRVLGSPVGRVDARVAEEGEEGQDSEQEGEQSEQDGEQQEQEASEEMLAERWSEEDEQTMEQWLKRIPDDPGGLLRRKFRLQHQRTGAAPDEIEEW